jgi:hypothetical protein
MQLSRGAGGALAWDLRDALNNPLKSSVRRWFRLSFLHTFFGLAHFCKKPCNPVFNVFRTSTKVKNVLLLFKIANVMGKCFAVRAVVLNLRHPLQCSTNHWHTINDWGGGFIFLIYCIQSQKGQFLKNLAAEQRSSPQGCTVRLETSARKSSLGGV